jgi:beta-galactosidase
MTSFDQIDLPNLTVTEPNPSHALDFRRFSSDQVARFNAGRLPRSAPGPTRRSRTTTWAGCWSSTISRWRGDGNRHLGQLSPGLSRGPAGGPAEHKRRHARQGDPDFQAFHHDLYRAVGRGRWWVMEQQPGPVNWAPHNPAPLPGMVRFWTWEAFAHGAECVSYFRWRQAPFAQEQYHAGLLRPDSVEAPAFAEAKQVAEELAQAPAVEDTAAPVALVFDYGSAWAWTVQPQGVGCDYFRLVFEVYRGLRKLGLSVDILPPDTADLGAYGLVLIPGLTAPSAALMDAIARADTQVILGPRTGAKTAALSIPVPLPPAIPGLDVTVARVETMRPDMPVAVRQGGHVTLWREDLEGSATVLDEDEDGRPVTMHSGNVTYLGGWPDPSSCATSCLRACADAGVATVDLPPDIRMRQSGDTRASSSTTGRIPWSSRAASCRPPAWLVGRVVARG